MKLSKIHCCVVTCHDPGTDISLESIKKELDDDDITIIENISPLPNAFNKAIELCNSDWMFQVDSDQLMYDGFAKRIQDDINQLSVEPKLFKIRYSSWDTFENRMVWASCKLFNMKILKKEKILFKNVQGCDRHFMYDYQQKGYKVISKDINEPIADHMLAQLGKGGLFSKYADRVGKDTINFIKPMINHWKEKIINENSVIHAAAIIGAYNPRKNTKERSREEERIVPMRIWIDNSSDEDIIKKAKTYLKIG